MNNDQSGKETADAETEPLLEGQRVFNGPRKLRENLLDPWLERLRS